MSKLGIVRTSSSSVDFLADRLIASYFDAKEHQSFYVSLREANARRDFHETIVPVLMDFVGEALSTPRAEALDAVIEATANASKVLRPARDLTAEARRLHPIGFDLLQIEGVMTMDGLKSLYRGAARRHHPDAGGSHDAMIQVNEAYGLFHDLLCRSQAQAFHEEESGVPSLSLEAQIKTTLDFAYSLVVLLMEIKLDEWSLDDAHHWVMLLLSPEWAASAYAGHHRVQSSLLFPCSKLAGRLWAAGMEREAGEVYRVAEESLRIAKEYGQFSGNDLSEADNYIKHGQKLRIVINHRRQADNALRLGLIDDRRHKKSVERFDGKKDSSECLGEALARYVAEVGFLQGLPPDRSAIGKSLRASLVPVASYFIDRVEKLSDDQQAEYLSAFGPKTSLVLVRKYTYLRLISLLRTLICHESTADFRAIERECRFLAKLQSYLVVEWCCGVAEIARQLSGLQPAVRGETCRILRELDELACDVHEFPITMGLSQTLSRGPTLDSTFRIRPDTGYLDIARQPLERLRLARLTGSILTKDEAHAKREIWNRDVRLSNSLRQSEDFKAAWEALDRAKDDPEAVVRLAPACVERLIDLAGSMVHTNLLGVGFWIDKLTIALTRLKRWEEAAGWLERFFSLPSLLQGESRPGDQESMMRRLERCRKMLTR